MDEQSAAGASSPWRPLRTPLFRNLLLADVLSDIGTFMQTVGAAWLMVSLGAGPMYVALTQTASALPFFLLALPAGAMGDIVDRRRLILYTEFWIVSARSRTHRYNNRRPHATLAVAGLDVLALGRRRHRNPDVACRSS